MGGGSGLVFDYELSFSFVIFGWMGGQAGLGIGFSHGGVIIRNGYVIHSSEILGRGLGSIRVEWHSSLHLGTYIPIFDSGSFSLCTSCVTGKPYGDCGMQRTELSTTAAVYIPPGICVSVSGKGHYTANYRVNCISSNIGGNGDRTSAEMTPKHPINEAKTIPLKYPIHLRRKLKPRGRPCYKTSGDHLLSLTAVNVLRVTQAYYRGP